MDHLRQDSWRITIYVSYPVYHPDREPAGYVDWLRRQKPELAWDRSKLNTKDDWIRAGQVVFDAPISYGGIAFRSAAGEDLYVRERGWRERVRPPATKEGIVPGYRYVIREQGKIEIGVLSCAMCHTRVMPDGTALRGAQGNLPLDSAGAEDLRSAIDRAPLNQKLLRLLYSTPWAPQVFEKPEQMRPEEMAALHKALEIFIAKYKDGLPDDAERQLALIADQVFPPVS
jgi:hypothetical protein